MTDGRRVAGPLSSAAMLTDEDDGKMGAFARDGLVTGAVELGWKSGVVVGTGLAEPKMFATPPNGPATLLVRPPRLLWRACMLWMRFARASLRLRASSCSTSPAGTCESLGALLAESVPGSDLRFVAPVAVDGPDWAVSAAADGAVEV